MSKNRMGGMGRLSDFGKTQTVEEPEIEPQPIEQPIEQKQQPRKRNPARQSKIERSVTVNIKITESQQEWLADTAKRIRQNNDSPTIAAERVYPQHLIQAAIDLLKSSDIDWGEVRNVSQLKEHLNL